MIPLIFLIAVLGLGIYTLWQTMEARDKRQKERDAIDKKFPELPQERRTFHIFYDVVEGEEPVPYLEFRVQKLCKNYRDFAFDWENYHDPEVEKCTTLGGDEEYTPKGERVPNETFLFQESCKKRTDAFEALENPSIESLCKAVKLLLENSK